MTAFASTVRAALPDTTAADERVEGRVFPELAKPVEPVGQAERERREEFERLSRTPQTFPGYA